MNYIESDDLIVLVESEIKHKILHKNIEKRKLKAIFKKNAPRKGLFCCWPSIEEKIASTAFAIVY